MFEYPLKQKAKAIIEGYDGPAVRVMEVCGTHTHEIFHLGLLINSKINNATIIKINIIAR